MFGVRVRWIVAQIQRREVLLAVEVLGQQTADGDGFAARSPVGLQLGLGSQV